MATIHAFEELDIWQKAQQFGADIYKMCVENEKINRDYSFKDQIKRAALSVSNNIAEGFEYNNNNDFYRFLRIAKGSCGEVRNCLLFAIKIGYAQGLEVHTRIEDFKMLSKQIGKLMVHVNLNRKKPIVDKPETRNPQPATS